MILSSEAEPLPLVAAWLPFDPCVVVMETIAPATFVTVVVVEPFGLLTTVVVLPVELELEPEPVPLVAVSLLDDAPPPFPPCP